MDSCELRMTFKDFQKVHIIAWIMHKLASPIFHFTNFRAVNQIFIIIIIFYGDDPVTKWRFKILSVDIDTYIFYSWAILLNG